MKLRLCVVVSVLLITHFSSAQYFIPVVVKDAFSKDILGILNDVPSNFKSIKGRSFKSEGGAKLGRMV
jgi:hypothetical protein